MLIVQLSATDESDVVKLAFEHSLVSLSKWESLYKKPFFDKAEKTDEEAMTYIKCMLVTEDVPDEILNKLSREDVLALTEYANDKQTATTFRDDPKQRKSNEVVTSEVIYYWLVQFNIPFEVERWHLNRLMTLVKIAGIRQTKPQTMTKAQQAEQYRSLNAERRAQTGSTG